MFLCIMDDDTNQMATAILPALIKEYIPQLTSASNLVIF
jgi:hypothetical protein